MADRRKRDRYNESWSRLWGSYRVLGHETSDCWDYDSEHKSVQISSETLTFDLGGLWEDISISFYPDPVLQREGLSIFCKCSSPFSARVFPFPLPCGSCRFCCLTISHFFPLNQLLIPHFRYTMEINILARNNLVSEWGIFDLVWKGMGEGGGVSQGYLPRPFFPPNSVCFSH